MDKCIVLIVPINKFRVDDFLEAIKPELVHCNVGPYNLFVKRVLNDSPTTEIIICLNNSIDSINLHRLLINIKFQGYDFEIKYASVPRFTEYA